MARMGAVMVVLGTAKVNVSVRAANR
jgi:hypothetical protein